MTYRGRKDTKQVYVNVTQRCSYSCSYCEFSYIEDKQDMDRNIFLSVIKNPTLKSKRLIITGGEPTLYPFLRDIDQARFTLFTNLTQDIKFYGQFNCNIRTSFHYAQCDDIDGFIEKVNSLDIEYVHVMLEHDDIDFYTFLFKELKRKAFLVPIRVKEGSNFIINKEYYKNFDITKYFDFPQYKIFVNNKQINEFQFLDISIPRVLCDIAKYKSIIYENGNVYNCQYRDKIGTFKDLSVLEKTDSIICHLHKCSPCNMRIGSKIVYNV